MSAAGFPFPKDHPILQGDCLYAPFRCEHDGVTYSVATDGKCAFLLEDSGSDLKEDDVRASALNRLLSDKTAPKGKILVSRLLDLCEDSLKSAPPCVECDGTGSVDFVDCWDCDGQGEIECDLGHFHSCKKCFGQGTREAPDGFEDPHLEECGDCRGSGRDRGSMQSACFDRVELDMGLLVKAFSRSPRDEFVEVFVSSQFDPAQFVGKGWRVIVAPLVPGNVSSSCKVELDSLV